MQILEPPSAPPIEIDDHGTWHVTGSRVTVEVVITQFNQGATPEQIQDDFPSLSLNSIYSVISYYLSHVTLVESSLLSLAEKARDLRTRLENDTTASLRTRLRAARDAKAAQ